MAAGAQLKVGDGCLAVDLDPIEHAFVLAVGRENAGDAAKCAQVGVPEGIRPADRREARLLRVPGPELAAGDDLPGWTRVGKLGVEGHGSARAGVIVGEMMDLETARRPSRCGGEKVPLRLIGSDN